MEQVTAYIEYLFALALRTCGDTKVAEDLAQDTLLAALQYQRQGREIKNLKYWLTSTLSHKWNDMLRAKYKLPTVSVDVIPEVEDDVSEADEEPSDEDVRREVAYLAALQRTVIVKHYLEGKKVDAIAKELGVPKGTVLSRLAAGREQMRKGFEKMEQYEKQSHTPERLELTCYGRPGFQDEPYSLVENDSLKQNILILAYWEPHTVTELARGLGVPTAYVELAVEYLVEKKLLIRVGQRVATAFRITTVEDRLRTLQPQLDLAKAGYDSIWAVITDLFSKLSSLPWYSGLDEVAQCDLRYYAMLHTFSGGIYQAMKRLVSTEEEYPARPDGGEWIAAGNRIPLDFDFEQYPIKEYCYGGERRARWERFLGSQSIDLHVYDTQPDLNKYQHGPVEIHDDMLCKLIYMLYKDVDFDQTAFNLRYLEDIPHLTECGILADDGNKIQVAIPIIHAEQYRELCGITNHAILQLADCLVEPLREALPRLRQELPAHLKGKICEYRTYHVHMIPMAVVKQAIAAGDFVIPNGKKVIPMVLSVMENEAAK